MKTLKFALILSFFYFFSSEIADAQCTSGSGVGGTPGVITDNGTICSGGSLTVTLTGTWGCTGSCEYLFLIKQAGTSNTYVSSPTVSTPYYTFPSGVLTTTGSYDVYGCVRGVNYCAMHEGGNTVSLSIISGISGPFSASASPSTICQGQATTLTGSVTSPRTIKWYDNVNGTGTPVGTGTSIVVYPTTTTTYYAFAYDTAMNCQSGTGTYQSVTVTVSGTAPSCGISANDTAYTNTALSISSSYNTGGNTYAFTFTGASPASATGVGPHSVTWTSTGSKTVQLLVTTTSTGCTTLCTKNIYVKQGCPTAIINGSANACVGVANSYSATDMGAGVGYSWTFGTGSSPASATGAGPHSVTWSSSGSKTVQLTVSLTGCSNSSSNLSVTAGTDFTAPVISGPYNGNTNTSYSYSTATVSGASYTWTAAGATITGSGNSVGMTWTTAGSKLIDLSINNSGCVKSDTHTVTIVVPACYTSKTRLSMYSLNTAMNNVTITDSASTSATVKVSNAVSFVNNKTLTRSNDTCFYWYRTNSNTPDSVTFDFNRDVFDLSFQIRDIDNTGPFTDTIRVFAYKNDGTRLDISTINYTIVDATRVGVINGGFRNPYTSASVANSTTNGDVSFSVPTGIGIRKLTVYVNTNVSSGSYNYDYGISELSWCTSVPLPVSFVNVAATAKPTGEVEISWKTASEINNSHFTIERANTATNTYETLATVPGAGNSNQLLQYSFTDYTAKAGMQYYRIKQTDFDGKFDYSETVSVLVNAINNVTVVHPNPFKDVLHIKNAGVLINNNPVVIRSVDGRVIETPAINGDENVLSINLSFLQRGVYFIEIADANGNRQIHKVFKN